MSRSQTLTLLGAALMLTASACDRPARSSSYFEQHEAERRSVLASCKSGAQRGYECEVAALAEGQATSADAEAKFRAMVEAK